MNEQLIQLLENYKDGVPVRIDRGSVVFICIAALFTVAASAIVVKYVRKL